MKTAKEYLLEKEVKLVGTFGEKTYMEEKVYFPEEVIAFMTDYAAYVKTETLKNFGLGTNGKIFKTNDIVLKEQDNYPNMESDGWMTDRNHLPD